MTDIAKAKCSVCEKMFPVWKLFKHEDYLCGSCHPDIGDLPECPECERELYIGCRVRILVENKAALEISETGVIYNYLPARPWPWHVRPDNWPPHVPGIAFSAQEIEPLEEER